MDKRFDLALNWIQSVRQPILDVYYNLKTVEIKSNNTEVTEADRSTEKDFRELILANFVDDGIIGEEFSEDNREGEYTWTIDPIDGTRSFARGVPLFGTMVGLYRDGEILFGITAYHALGELIYAIKGKGCYWKGLNAAKFEKVHISSTSDLRNAVMCLSGEEYFTRQNESELLNRFKSCVHFVRTWGDCYGYCLLARGKIDIMVDPMLHQWDFVPTKIIVEEAGGLVRSIDGSETGINSTSVICANSALMESLLQQLV